MKEKINCLRNIKLYFTFDNIQVKGAKSINKRSNLSNDTRLKGVERNNERVNRRFNVAEGGARAKQKKKINGRRQKEEKCVTLYARQAFREKG